MAKDFKIEGQLDFLDMMGAYTDDIGATVRVSKPRTKVKNRNDGEASNLTISSPKPFESNNAQLEFSLEIKDAKDKCTETINSGFEVLQPVQMSFELNEKQEDENNSQKLEVKEPMIQDKQPEESNISANDDKPEEKEIIPAETAENKESSEKSSKLRKKISKPKDAKVKNSDSEVLFEKCRECWCFDCKHNSRNEGKPREMCGVMMPCPACKSCMDQGFAEICVIGSAKEGCKTRAVEEGISSDDYEE